MGKTATRKLIDDHLVEGVPEPGETIALRVDQTLTQDATGTLVMLALEAMDLDRVRTEVSVQYADHNIFQADNKNPDDHRYLRSACRRFGLLFSPPGNGVSHPVHMQRFGVPGKTLLGSDSHSCAAGSLGMLAMGAGGLDVAAAMAGEPFHLDMPEIWGVRLTGALPPWVSAKDVILEMLRRHGVDGGLGRIVEYHGPGVARLSAMDRHVIANMGAELGATTTVFPSDDETRRFLSLQGREDDWREIAADAGAAYDVEDEIDLSALVPLVAMPSSPGNVVTVEEVAGKQITQAYLGSSANPGYRDFAIAAYIVDGTTAASGVSLDINPTSRQQLHAMIGDGTLATLVDAGARVHQTGCNGCIGMGQAPASGQISLRTTPRNFPGRSGTPDDKVYLCSPETAAVSAIRGCITDPRSMEREYPAIAAADRSSRYKDLIDEPPPADEARQVELVRGPNIKRLPDLEEPADRLELEIVLSVGDDISTDGILPAGAEVLPYRSNIPAIAEFAFRPVDKGYVERARQASGDGHAIVGGKNYGQGSSREHAALAPRYLGLRAVLAGSFARIHRQNLINFGVLPLVLDGTADWLKQGARLTLSGLGDALAGDGPVRCAIGDTEQDVELAASRRERTLLAAGGYINFLGARS
jgi:aconitate hydratase